MELYFYFIRAELGVTDVCQKAIMDINLETITLIMLLIFWEAEYYLWKMKKG